MARKVTEEIYKAWLHCKRKTIGNTRTDGKSVFLHSHEIIRTVESHTEFCLAGWNTRTTRERVNYFLAPVFTIRQVKGEPVLFKCEVGKPARKIGVLDDTEWYDIDILTRWL